MSDAIATKSFGTCPCCFGVFVVSGGKLARHGYSRPGDGRDHGRCFGAGKAAFETVSGQAVAVFFAATLRVQVADAEAYLASIPAKTFLQIFNWRGAQEGYSCFVNTVERFEYAQGTKTAEARSEAVMTGRALKAMEEKLAGWQELPLRASKAA